MKVAGKCVQIITGILLVIILISTSALAFEVPVSQEEHNIDGRQTIIKVYEVLPHVSPASLVEEDFVQNGFVYSMTGIVKETITTLDKKEVAMDETVSVSVSNKTTAQESALGSFPEFVEYDQDGYVGKLYPVLSSLTGNSTGSKTTSGTKTITKTYTYEYNDDSLVPKTADGYSLSSISWAEGSYLPDSSIPENYIATATYSKSTSSTTNTGWDFTMVYSGIVEYEHEDMIRYTVTYTGEEIIPEPEPEPTFWEKLFGKNKMESVDSSGDRTSTSGTKNESSSIPKLLLILLCFIIAIAAAVFGVYTLFRVIRNRRVQILARDEVSGEYNPIKSVAFSKKTSTVTIDTLAAPSSQHFQVKIKPTLAEDLKGKVITVKAGQQIFKHQIGDAGGADYIVDVSLI